MKIKAALRPSFRASMLSKKCCLNPGFTLVFFWPKSSLNHKKNLFFEYSYSNGTLLTLVYDFEPHSWGAELLCFGLIFCVILEMNYCSGMLAYHTDQIGWFTMVSARDGFGPWILHGKENVFFFEKSWCLHYLVVKKTCVVFYGRYV
ncbi:hypothetical protein MATL_G00089090, partial [Megalops atlanticus]